MHEIFRKNRYIVCICALYFIKHHIVKINVNYVITISLENDIKINSDFGNVQILLKYYIKLIFCWKFEITL